MSDKKIFTYSLSMCLIFLIMGCEGDSYCMGPDNCDEGDHSYSNNGGSYPYIIECESNEVPIAIVDVDQVGIYGVIGGDTVNYYEYKQFYYGSSYYNYEVGTD